MEGNDPHGGHRRVSEGGRAHVGVIQMPGNYPEESIQHSDNGKSLKSQINIVLYIHTHTWK